MRGLLGNCLNGKHFHSLSMPPSCGSRIIAQGERENNLNHNVTDQKKKIYNFNKMGLQIQKEGSLVDKHRVLIKHAAGPNNSPLSCRNG